MTNLNLFSLLAESIRQGTSFWISSLPLTSLPFLTNERDCCISWCEKRCHESVLDDYHAKRPLWSQRVLTQPWRWMMEPGWIWIPVRVWWIACVTTIQIPTNARPPGKCTLNSNVRTTRLPIMTRAFQKRPNISLLKDWGPEDEMEISDNEGILIYSEDKGMEVY